MFSNARSFSPQRCAFADRLPRHAVQAPVSALPTARGRNRATAICSFLRIVLDATLTLGRTPSKSNLRGATWSERLRELRRASRFRRPPRRVSPRPGVDEPPERRWS